MIQIKNLSKQFYSADNTVDALRNINITINTGDIYGIIGMSGAGKSTLVRCINMLERPTSGSVVIDDVDMAMLPENKLRDMRRNIAMIFQSFNLLMQRNCLDNICFPLELTGVSRTEAIKKAAELLEIVGLPDKAKSYPSQLSGGQQQRIAIARALASNPRVLLCDEATSALDPNTTGQILDLIKDINEKLGITVIVITHQMSVVEKICNRVAILENGSVVEDGEVSEVFSSPKSDAAKRLVFPEGEADALLQNINEQTVRIIYNGSTAAGRPLIAGMASDEGIIANILFASSKFIGDKVYGSMLLGIPDKDLDRAMEYLRRDPLVLVEHVDNPHRIEQGDTNA